MAKKLFAMLLLLCSLPCWGHSQLVKSEPENEAVLSTPPPQLNLFFDKQIEPTLHQAELWREGSWRKLPTTAGDRTLTISLPDKNDKAALKQYRIRWSVLSSDGHRQRGQIQFSIR